MNQRKDDEKKADKAFTRQKDQEFAREKEGFVDPKRPELGKAQAPKSSDPVKPDSPEKMKQAADVNADNPPAPESGTRSYPPGGQSAGLRQQPGRPTEGGPFVPDDAGRSGPAGADTKKDYKEEERHVGRPPNSPMGTDPEDTKY